MVRRACEAGAYVAGAYVAGGSMYGRRDGHCC